MSAFIFRFTLGMSMAWALGAAAQDYSAERASPFGVESSDSYVADPAQSYVTEGDAPAEAETPIAAWEPRRPQYEPPYDQRLDDQPQYRQPAYDPAPYCRAYYPAGPGRDRSGTLCEQSDGALRMTETPRAEISPRTVSAPASQQYCREYQQDDDAGVAYGKACWQRDGSWQIVSAARGVPGRDYPRAYAAAPEPRRAPQWTAAARSYSPRPAERRLKLPEFYFGNLFGWLSPHEGRY